MGEHKRRGRSSVLKGIQRTPERGSAFLCPREAAAVVTAQRAAESSVPTGPERKNKDAAGGFLRTGDKYLFPWAGGLPPAILYFPAGILNKNHQTLILVALNAAFFSPNGGYM